MKTRTIANRSVGALGLGCMGMTWAYGSGDQNRAEHVRVIQRALELGMTVIDTAEVYGPYTNEELVGQALAGRREKAFLATKCGLVHRSPPKDGFRDGFDIAPNGRPEAIRASIEGSLRRLRTDAVDLYQLHRVDPNVPLEESWGAMADLVRAGKAKAIGLSETSVEQIERAHRIFPVASVQSELSIWTRDHEPVVRHCAKAGITFLAYSPLGRGFLTGRFASTQDFDKDDWRRNNPRFAEPAMQQNRTILRAVQAVAARRGVTAAQVALAWTIAQADNVVPIPGTRSIARLEENARAADVELTADDLGELAALTAPVGARY